MQIRRLTQDSYDSIIALWEKSDLPFKPQGRDKRKEMEDQIERAPDLFLGAFEKERMVGVIIGSDDGRKGWINRLAVDPNFREKGIAKELIAKIEDALKARGRKIICTLVEDPNDVSFSLFNKLGYVKHDNIHYLSKREGDHI
jgi:ribosomal protein S18 acetylase RimI-like enzyme